MLEISRRSLLVTSIVMLGACDGLREAWSEDVGPFAGVFDGMVDARWTALGLDGSGVDIGVIDAGFGGFREDRFTSRLRIAGMANFVSQSQELFEGADKHGTTVSGYIGGFDGEHRRGLASGANYWLAQGEDEQTEFARDEAIAIAALDWMVANGVRIINISLGFSRFSDKSPYGPADMNGSTTAISRRLAGHLAADPMLIAVVSAGNEGDNDDWRVVTAPGDVEEAITVGSADVDGKSRSDASGMGSPAAPFVKPDLVAASGHRGASSVATAAVTGLVGCMRQARPKATRAEIREALFTAGSNAARPNRSIGHGIVDATAAVTALRKEVA